MPADTEDLFPNSGRNTVNDRLNDIEDVLLGMLAILATVIPGAIEGDQPTPEEMQAVQLRMATAAERIYKRYAIHK